MRTTCRAMSGDTTKGIFVTTSDFHEKARHKAQMAHHKITLINGKQLASYMYEYDVGVQEKQSIVLKELMRIFLADYCGS